MKLILESRNGKYKVTAEYNPETKMFVVVKGAKVFDYVAQSEKFRGVKLIIESRKNIQ